MEQYIFAPTVCGAELEEELAAALEKRMEIFSRASLPGMWKKNGRPQSLCGAGQRAERSFTEDPSAGADPRGTFSGDPGTDGAEGAAHAAHRGRLLYAIGRFKPFEAASGAKKRFVPSGGGRNAAKYERPCGSERAGRF